jgi:hypothetical protein
LVVGLEDVTIGWCCLLDWKMFDIGDWTGRRLIFVNVGC